MNNLSYNAQAIQVQRLIEETKFIESLNTDDLEIVHSSKKRAKVTAGILFPKYRQSFIEVQGLNSFYFPIKFGLLLYLSYFYFIGRVNF